MTGEATTAGCVFCAARDGADDSLVVFSGRDCFVILNKYPYNNGHLMVVPNRHIATVSEATPAELSEMMALAARAELAIREAYAPHGLNMGINLGKPAGAGILDHLHLHVVPRWNGDTNFMTVVGETRVLPEELTVTARGCGRSSSAWRSSRARPPPGGKRESQITVVAIRQTAAEGLPAAGRRVCRRADRAAGGGDRREQRVPARRSIREAAALGLMGVTSPARDGGAAATTSATRSRSRQLAKASSAVAVIAAVNNSLVAEPLARFGSHGAEADVAGAAGAGRVDWRVRAVGGARRIGRGEPADRQRGSTNRATC